MEQLRRLVNKKKNRNESENSRESNNNVKFENTAGLEAHKYDGLYKEEVIENNNNITGSLVYVFMYLQIN